MLASQMLKLNYIALPAGRVIHLGHLWFSGASGSDSVSICQTEVLAPNQAYKSPWMGDIVRHDDPRPLCKACEQKIAKHVDYLQSIIKREKW